MSDEIRVGDRFLVEMTVTDPVEKDSNFGPVAGVTAEGARGHGLPGINILRAAKRLPRRIKVGDRVCWNYYVFNVEHIARDQAWIVPVNSPEDTGRLVPLSNLSPADKD